MVETVTNPAPTMNSLDPDVRAHRQQPHCDGHRQRLRPRLDRGVGRHPLTTTYVSPTSDDRAT